MEPLLLFEDEYGIIARHYGVYGDLSRFCLALFRDAGSPAAFSTATRGIVTVNWVPPTGIALALIDHPWRSEIHRAIDRPRPAPPIPLDRTLSALQNRSKMWGRSLSAIPIPVSMTLTIAHSAPASNRTPICPPSGVYLTALSTRMTNSRRIASASAITATGSSPVLLCSVSFFLSAGARHCSTAWRRIV